MHLDAADALSGIATVEYSIDGGAWQSGAEHDFTLARKRSNTGRVYAVEYRATDAAGNVTGGSCAVHIDNRAPKTTDDSDGLAHAVDTTVHLTASDAHSGVAETWYSLDGAPWVEGTDVLVPAPVDHTGDGLHTVVYYSVDAVGNIEAVRMCTVLIDTAGADRSVDDAGDGWHANGWTMHLDAADALSGIATVEHSIDGGAWQSGAEHVFTLARKRSNTGRVYAVEYRADRRGRQRHRRLLRRADRQPRPEDHRRQRRPRARRRHDGPPDGERRAQRGRRDLVLARRRTLGRGHRRPRAGARSTTPATACTPSSTTRSTPSATSRRCACARCSSTPVGCGRRRRARAPRSAPSCSTRRSRHVKAV